MLRWFNCLPHRRRRPCVSLERETRKISPGQRAASAALAQAIAAGPEVHGLVAGLKREAAALQRARDRNHFAEAMNELYRGGHR